MRVFLTDRVLTNGYTLGLAGGLRRNGVEPWIGGPARSGDSRVTAIFPESAPGRRVRKTLDVLTGAVRFQHLLARRPDIVHFQWPTAFDAIFAITARRMYGIPIAYTVHNFHRAGDGRAYEESQTRLIALANLVLTHGPSIRDAIIAAQPSASSKTHVVEHGNYEDQIERHPRLAARATLGLPPDGPLYLFVGQIRPRKGIETLIHAFAEHRRCGGRGHLLIVGNATVPDYAQRLHNLADAYKTPVHWKLAGLPLPQQTIDLAISAANQVVLPFHAASQSGSVILAMTHGRCVVSTAVGEIPRTLQDRGIIVEPGDRAALLTAMGLAEDSPEQCDEFGARARSYALTTLSWNAIAARLVTLYESREHTARSSSSSSS